jgi:hypothetical protein
MQGVGQIVQAGMVYKQVCRIAAEDVGWVFEGCWEDDYTDYLLFSVPTTSITGHTMLTLKKYDTLCSILVGTGNVVDEKLHAHHWVARAQSHRCHLGSNS